MKIELKRLNSYVEYTNPKQNWFYFFFKHMDWSVTTRKSYVLDCTYGFVYLHKILGSEWIDFDIQAVPSEKV